MLSFLVPFSLYLVTAPRYVVGFGDSAEMVMSAFNFQAAHPPGYPLYILLGKLFTLIPISTVFFRVSLLSSTISALTVFFIYKTLKIIFSSGNRDNNSFLSSLSSFAGSMFIAFFYSIWLYAIVPEVHAFNNLLVTAIVYLSIFTVSNNVKDQKNLFIIFFLFGLGLSNHLTIVLLLPPTLLYLLLNGYLQSRQAWKGAVVSLSAGLLPYLFVFVSAYFPHFPMYGNITGLQRFLEYILRSDYGGLASGGYKEPALSGSFPLSTYFYLWKLILKGYLYVPLAGAVYLSFTHLNNAVKSFSLVLQKEPDNKTVLVFGSPEMFLWISTVLIAVIFPIFSLWGLSDMDTHIRAVTEHFSLTEFLLVGILSVIGIYQLMHKLMDRYIENDQMVKLLYLSVMLTLAAILIFLNFRDVNKRDFNLMHNFAANMLSQVPNGSIIFASDDIKSFLLIYLTQVEQIKPDVKIISNGFLSNVYYQKELKNAWPDLYDTSSTYSYDIARNIIEKNAEKGVYFATFDDPYPYGFLGNPNLLNPEGMLIYASPKTTKEDLIKNSEVNFWEKYDYGNVPFSQNTKDLKSPELIPSSDNNCKFRDEFTCLTLWNYYFKAKINSQVYVNADCRECAQRQIDLAAAHIGNKERLSSDLSSIKKEKVGNENDSKSLLELAKGRFLSGNPTQSDFHRTAWDLLRAEKLDQKNPEIQGGLGEIFEMLKVYDISFEKYKTAARLDPFGGWEESMERVLDR